MTDVQERQLNLDLSFIADQMLPGYRLQRVEVFNWGTFDRAVHKLHLEGRNGLLTGDIGSGKSTFVDAITTLLVPANRISYNKAAGAETKERSLKTYVLGHHKSEKNEMTGVARPVGLRDNNCYSVILGVFQNTGFESKITLAQVFWIKDPGAPPNRLYVCAEDDLSIANDFADFGTDIAKLKKRLTARATLFDSFAQYGAWFRRYLGIAHEQALELFHQTVSMKQVGNLTEFVRMHMLQEFDVKSRIDHLTQHFEDLTRAHDAVKKAARQVDLLTPIVQDCRTHAEIATNQSDLRATREALRTYFSQQKCRLLIDRIDSLTSSRDRQSAKLTQLELKLQDLRGTERDIRVEIAENGGTRIEQLGQQITDHQREFDARKERSIRYVELAQIVDMSCPHSDEQFFANRQSITSSTEHTRTRQAEIQNEITELGVNLKEKNNELKQLSDEIESLKSRRSNIPREQISIRTRMCQALSIEEKDLPFVGEHLQVADEHSNWEGAAERLLRGFGMSLLVPERHYSAIADWVDRINLKGHIVYFNVRKQNYDTPATLHRQALARKICIKTDSAFYDWLERELNRRADLICCDNQTEFKRESRAITHTGQIKTPGGKHEKDDRFHIDDRSRYVLGWSNEAKLRALQSQFSVIQTEGRKLTDAITSLQAEHTNLGELATAYSKLEEYSSFHHIDWNSTAKHIANLQQEKAALEASSDVLQQLKQRLKEVEGEISSTDQDERAERKKLGGTELKLEQSQESLREVESFSNDPENQMHLSKFEFIEKSLAESKQDDALTLENCDSQERQLRSSMGDQIDAAQKKLERLQTKIVTQMTKYNGEYRLETQEFDPTLESAHEYDSMLAQLRADDLPRFEAQFKQLLNVNTIREIANFQAQLNKERETIKERLEQINESLTIINYNESVGTYIKVEHEPTLDQDIRTFQQDLKICTEGALTGSEDEQYTEAKFEQVKQILDRFRGRDGLTEPDKKWTQRVTDVRNWFTFAASERRREDNSEFEHYSDSGGKSGGQKEKLAYTILAASLAYQFGIDPRAPRAREFRFVMIDEAFGKGSDESARFGLKLFTGLQMQLLVVTPLQKTHIIEPFVNSVGFVQNPGGASSSIVNMTIQEYHDRKTSFIQNLKSASGE